MDVGVAHPGSGTYVAQAARENGHAAAQVEADYARLRALQPTLFEVESVETGDGVA